VFLQQADLFSSSSTGFVAYCVRPDASHFAKLEPGGLCLGWMSRQINRFGG